MSYHNTTLDIAIIGMSGRFPQSPSVNALWKTLVQGNNCITTIPKTRWTDNSHPYRWGGFIDDVDSFDTTLFKIPPTEAAYMDPQQRLLLESAWETLEDAGYGNTDSLSSKTVGVYMATIWHDYSLLTQEQKQTQHGPGALSWYLSNRISYAFNFQGPSMTIDTACSSSLTAVHLACQSIATGESHLALVGGVNLSLHPGKYRYLSNMTFLSSKGQCRSFGKGGDGYVPGEGVCSILLKPLKDAKHDKDHIYGIIKGSALNHGGQTEGLTVPRAKAQSQVIRNALKQAQATPRTIRYIECHGTGTLLGDPIEIAGLHAIYKTDHYKPSSCGLGSIKSNIGHLEGAAGLAGLIKVLLAITHNTLPKSLHATPPNKLLDFKKSPFYIVTKNEPWTDTKIKSGYAAVSSFGAGGSNAHMIVAPYAPPTQPKYPDQDIYLIPLSARRLTQLKGYARKVINDIEEQSTTHDQDYLRNLAYTLQVGRRAFDYRILFQVNSLSELKEQLIQYTNGNTDYPHDISQQSIETLNIKTAIKEKNWALLRQYWTHGGAMDWNLLYSNHDRPHRISVPSSPFIKERFWLPKKETKKETCPTRPNSDLSLETTITKIITDITGITQQLNGHTPFSELGIDSILLKKITDRINNVLDTKLTTMDLHLHPSIMSLLTYINNAPPQPKTAPHYEARTTQAPTQEVAIIGLHLQIPGSNSLTTFWDRLQQEHPPTPYPKERWKRLPKSFITGKNRDDYQGYFIDHALTFDHRFFKLSPREAMVMDPQQRLLLQSVYHAISHAGYSQTEFAKKQTAVFVALDAIDYAHISRYDTRIDEFTETGCSASIAANRISHHLGLEGLSEVINTACSSVFVALERAIDALNKGRCDQAIVCGAQLNLDPHTFTSLKKNLFLSQTGHTQPFDQEANGYIRGEGLGTIIIKQRDKAIHDQDSLYGLIKGVGVWHDGKGLSLTTPNPKSCETAMTEAIQQSHVSIDQITYIEAHGTGMPMGDNSEIAGINRVFKTLDRSHTKKCCLSTLKPSLGHLEAASGIPALIKALLALQKGEIPGIWNLKNLHTDIKAQSTDSGYLTFSNTVEKLHQETSAPHVAGLHAYGLGGVSAFVVMEKIRETESHPPTLTAHSEIESLFVLSAQSETQLKTYLKTIPHYIKETQQQTHPITFDTFIRFMQSSATSMPCRVAIIATDFHTLIACINALETSSNAIWWSQKNPNNDIIDINTLNQWIDNKNWKALAKAWVNGQTIPWPSYSGQRCPLPPYPFDTSKEHWVKISQTP